MSRRHSAEKREINPDPKFGNLVVSKFMNSIMYEGKKSVAVDDLLGDRFLALVHDGVHELGHDQIPEFRIGIDLALLGTVTSGHSSLSSLTLVLFRSRSRFARPG